MTVEEYRAALNRLSPTDFATFREKWGGAKTTVDPALALVPGYHVLPSRNSER